jgi:hypothetical protein
VLFSNHTILAKLNLWEPPQIVRFASSHPLFLGSYKSTQLSKLFFFIRNPGYKLFQNYLGALRDCRMRLRQAMSYVVG